MKDNLLVGFFLLALFCSLEIQALPVHGYPRIMGVNISRPSFYDDISYQKAMSKTDVLIMGFWPKWKEYKYGKDGMANVAVATAQWECTPLLLSTNKTVKLKY